MGALEPYPAGPIDIEMARSANGGSSFALVTNPMSEQVVPGDSDDDSHLRRPGAQRQHTLLGLPQIAVDPDAALHAVYSYDPDGAGVGDVVNSYYRRSSTGSAGCDPPIHSTTSPSTISSSRR